jgi:hypothetical protein
MVFPFPFSSSYLWMGFQMVQYARTFGTFEPIYLDFELDFELLAYVE